MDMKGQQTQREIIKKYAVKAKKSLGQNFLCDESVPAAIAEALEISENEIIFEIGPGLGALSVHLAGKGAHFAAVELDASLIEILREVLAPFDNTEIIQGDALKFDFDDYALKLGCEKYKIAGNLPYYITTPIIMHILENCRNWQNLAFMMQKEVAQRLTASCGSSLCGAITYSVFYHAEARILMQVPPQAFMPRPEVDSAVVLFTKRDKPPVQTVDEDFMFRLVKAGFAQRRKTLLNSLSNNNIAEKTVLQKAFQECGLDEKRRGESLTLAEYALLADVLSR